MTKTSLRHALRSLRRRFRAVRTEQEVRDHPWRAALRIALWGGHVLLRVPARARFRELGFRLYLPPALLGGGSARIYVLREGYEPELNLLPQLLSPGMRFVDGGANLGVFTFAGAALVGAAGRVLAAEPGAGAFRSLERSLALNAGRHVTLRQVAIGDRAEEVRLYHHGKASTAFSLGAPGKADTGHELVTLTTLDALVEDAGLDRVDVIKLDIEGAEELALRGAMSLLRRDHPSMLLEVNPGAARRLGLDERGALDLLRGLGYRLYRVTPEGGIDSDAEVSESIMPGRSTNTANFIAIHRDGPHGPDGFGLGPHLRPRKG